MYLFLYLNVKIHNCTKCVYNMEKQFYFQHYRKEGKNTNRSIFKHINKLLTSWHDMRKSISDQNQCRKKMAIISHIFIQWTRFQNEGKEPGKKVCMNLSIPQYKHLSEGNFHEHVLIQHLMKIMIIEVLWFSF